jgi:hypothetical protein
MKNDIENIIFALDMYAAIISIASLIMVNFNITKTIELLALFAVVIAIRLLLGDATASKKVSLKINNKVSQ